MTLRARGFPLVIAAPSGAGKTSIARALVERHPEIVFSVSATTRPARAGERDGVDYSFVDEAGFDGMLAAGELLEWAHVHGRRYGTPKGAVRAAIDAGRIVVLDIDVQGARQVKAAFPDAVLVFILPPGGSELKRRLKGRATEGPEQTRNRLRNALAELDGAREFDHIVVNDDLERAIGVVESVVRCERGRRERLDNLDEVLAGLADEIRAFLDRS